MVHSLLDSHQKAVLVVIAVICFAFGYQFGTGRVQTKEVEKIVYRDRVVENKESQIDRNTRETRLPDGTVIKETIQSRNTRTRVDSESSLSSDRELTKTARPEWRITGGYQPPIPSFQESRWSVGLEKQLIGELYGGLSVTSERTVGFSLSLGY